jgi:glycerol-3-phosphate dehydrogenase (NAD(P)+)
MRLGILGAGAWGTALAIAAARRHPVRLWARDASQAEAMQQARCNQRYLPDAPWPDELAVSADLSAVLAHAQGGLLVVATPMAGLRDMLSRLPAGAAVLWLCKGFESGTGLLGHQIAAAVAPGLRAGALSGPSFAQEVAAGLPTALVAASADAALCEQAVQAFHGGALR